MTECRMACCGITFEVWCDASDCYFRIENGESMNDMLMVAEEHADRTGHLVLGHESTLYRSES